VRWDWYQQIGIAIPKIVCINQSAILAEFVMPGLFDVSKEIILVTGASQGLGRQFARVLSAHGAAVALAARQTAKLKSLEDEIRGQGGRAAAVQMAEAILKDKKRLLPVCAHLEGEYGFRDIYLGVPAILGSRGLEKIVELDLTAEEKTALAKSAEDVKKGIADLELEPATR